MAVLVGRFGKLFTKRLVIQGGGWIEDDLHIKGDLTVDGDFPGGVVDTVNGQIGTVVLDASDVGALADTYAPAAADISDATATGEALITAASASAARTAIGALDAAAAASKIVATGTSTLVGGTVVVNNANVVAGSMILLTTQVLGTVTVATPVAVTARSAGVSFTITSANVVDTSTVSWMIINP